MQGDGCYSVPITKLNRDEEVGNEGNAGGAGLEVVI